jgi:hypothetical protein
MAVKWIVAAGRTAKKKDAGVMLKKKLRGNSKTVFFMCAESHANISALLRNCFVCVNSMAEGFVGD